MGQCFFVCDMLDCDTWSAGLNRCDGTTSELVIRIRQQLAIQLSVCQTVTDCKLIFISLSRVNDQLLTALMAQVHINNIRVLNDNPAPALSQIQFEITFESFRELPGTFDWRIVYLGSPNDPTYDQIIEEFDISGMSAGGMSLNTNSHPPDFTKIPAGDILGTTAIVLSVSYEGQEFFRVGYYVVNECLDSPNEPPAQPQLTSVVRKIMVDNPRIMRFQIQWNKHRGDSSFNSQLLQKNIQTMGGDPFQNANQALSQLDKINYSFGMFGSNSQ